MSATTQVTTFSDLYTDLQNRVRVQTGVTATENQAKRYINIALHDMHLGVSEKYPWSERSATLLTQPKYTTGTVAISKGSTALAGTSTLWATVNDFSANNARVGGKIIISGKPEVYEVTTVTDDTNIVLSQKWIDDTETAATYVYYEDEYALHADFLRPIDQRSFDQNRHIDLIGRTEFRRRYPRNKSLGKPKVATIVDKAFSGDTTRVRKVIFWRPPDVANQIPYSFITNKLAVSAAGTEQTQLSADTDEPIVPLYARHAIVFHALYHWYRDKKDDNRRKEAKADYDNLIGRLLNDQEIGSPRPRLQPRIGPYMRAAKRPYSRGGHRFTTGDSFDEFRS